MPCDIIDLPDRGDSPEESIYIEFTLPNSYPTERFRFLADWNDVMGKWIFSLRWVGMGTILRRMPAQLRYAFDDAVNPDRLTLIFVDPTGAEKEVTPKNLGEEVYLTIWPGPLAPEYDPSTETADGKPEYDRLLVPDTEAERDQRERYDAPADPVAASAFDEGEYDESPYQ